MPRCVWCDIPLDYYSSNEHAGRQNCMMSNSGYHTFSHFPCLSRLFLKKTPRKEALLRHRRQKRPNTI